MWITSMGNHGAVGVSQNAGILVVLVLFQKCLLVFFHIIVITTQTHVNYSVAARESWWESHGEERQVDAMSLNHW